MLFRRQDINAELAACRNTPHAALVDVRKPEEYQTGHIPGAINIPLSTIRQIQMEKDTPIFIYCLRGRRSRRAAGILKRMGFAAVRSIGGMTNYGGRLER